MEKYIFNREIKKKLIQYIYWVLKAVRMIYGVYMKAYNKWHFLFFYTEAVLKFKTLSNNPALPKLSFYIFGFGCKYMFLRTFQNYKQIFILVLLKYWVY